MLSHKQAPGIFSYFNFFLVPSFLDWLTTRRYPVHARAWQAGAGRLKGQRSIELARGSDDVPFAISSFCWVQGARARLLVRSRAKGATISFISPANSHAITASRQRRSARSRPLLSNS